jgi:hypothetical protein
MRQYSLVKQALSGRFNTPLSVLSADRVATKKLIR